MPPPLWCLHPVHQLASAGAAFPTQPFLSSFPLHLLGLFLSSPDITEATLNWSSVSDWVLLHCALHGTHRVVCDIKRWSFRFPESHRILSRSCFHCWHQCFWNWFHRYMSVLKDTQWFQYCGDAFVVVQSLSCVWLFATPWTAARQAPLSFTISRNLLRCMSVELVMSLNHLILCCPHHLLPSVFPSIRVFSDKSVLCIRWPKYWSFSFSPSSTYSGLISFRIDCFDLLAVQGTFKSLLQHHHSKASSLQCSSFFMLLTLHTCI